MFFLVLLVKLMLDLDLSMALMIRITNYASGRSWLNIVRQVYVYM